ncbi:MULTISPECIES: AAA family ATPase [unclassified Moorena]|uniref:ParA family protein n=1 Tax=unclassified Moorena TaxID=2683338 RepID=UPI0013BF3F45|nr:MULTISPECIES: AAA family ATPase [unclassified Moorena]NES44032.1 AAA family ATPase [Moorena sp. SIO2C4]NET63520.1 AAA family ATPase [Moorena sp. SIO1G6]
MKLISVFNNKGGVGKTTLTYHLACALAELGKKVLMLDLDPQCNLTIYGLDSENLHKIWQDEDGFIDDFNATRKKFEDSDFESFNRNHRTIHYILKPIEDGISEPQSLPRPIEVATNLDLIPGRLTLHMYENKIAERWAGLYSGEPLSIRTITQIRAIARRYASESKYDFIIVDTSPSLGALNKVIISTVDGFLVPCFPDMFSLYGIRNIGKSLLEWKKDFDTIYTLISSEKRNEFPERFVSFLGFTIYNAKKYSGRTTLNLAQAAYNYANRIPQTVRDYISSEVRQHLDDEMIDNPIGDQEVMHTHNTLPSMAQKYRVPIWKVPDVTNLEGTDRNTIIGNQAIYKATKNAYKVFTEDLLRRINRLNTNPEV